MTIHLLVVGQHESSASDLGISEAANLAVETQTFRVARCRSPGELVKTVRAAALSSGQLVDVLDVYDHGLPGRQDLGEDTLFDHEGTGRQTARALRPILTPDARVRLLGCKTAVGSQGQRLLLMLREELGGAVVVYGTTAMIVAGDPEAQDFDAGGFKKVREDSFLFSSTDAANRILESRESRTRELREWYATLG